MRNRYNTTGDEVMSSRSRSPYIDREKIKQLKTYQLETEKVISKLKKIGKSASMQIDVEKQLMISIENDIQELKKESIRSEFNRYDYFPRY
ncbi:hypothetical protein ACFL0Q_08315 [Thermodesulfobacteriota bacterium]